MAWKKTPDSDLQYALYARALSVTSPAGASLPDEKLAMAPPAVHRSEPGAPRASA